MFVQSKGTSNFKHKNGLCLQSRRGGRETLVQWENGDQRWEPTHDLDGKIVFVDNGTSREDDYV